mmetsp:Transcript_16533/g.37150  ORF Transcript_16533/g.37150 Transcript_16533/m.37150 type:complete len:257 (+) Transcript_16533:155-925(+)
MAIPKSDNPQTLQSKMPIKHLPKMSLTHPSVDPSQIEGREIESALAPINTFSLGAFENVSLHLPIFKLELSKMSNFLSLESLDTLNKLTDRLIQRIFIKRMNIQYSTVQFSTLFLSQRLHHEGNLTLKLKKIAFIRSLKNDFARQTYNMTADGILSSSYLEYALKNVYETYSKSLIEYCLDSSEGLNFRELKTLTFLGFVSTSELETGKKHISTSDDNIELKQHTIRGAFGVSFIFCVLIASFVTRYIFLKSNKEA